MKLLTQFSHFQVHDNPPLNGYEFMCLVSVGLFSLNSVLQLFNLLPFQRILSIVCWHNIIHPIHVFFHSNAKTPLSPSILAIFYTERKVLPGERIFIYVL